MKTYGKRRIIMSEKIFREKSLERISSPEELNSYIKSTTPSLWFVLIAIIVLLVGVIVWATVGKIDAGSDCGCSLRNGEYTCYINEVTYTKMEKNQNEAVLMPFIKIDSIESQRATSIEGPIQVVGDADDYLFHLSSIESRDWYYIVKGKMDGVKDGQYKGFIVTDEVSPLSFIFN